MSFEVGAVWRTVAGDRRLKIKTAYGWTEKVTIEFLDLGKEEVELTRDELKTIARPDRPRCRKCGADL